jgi:hypothetical protein
MNDLFANLEIHNLLLKNNQPKRRTGSELLCP